MDTSQDVLNTVRGAFSGTISLKLRQLYEVVPRGSNSALTGLFVEELVRGFIRDWISPCLLLRGTLHPHDANTKLPSKDRNPKEIDGIVYDPRLGPAIIREGGFLVAHPVFCRGIIEIRTSERDLKGFEDELRMLYDQYLVHYGPSPYLNENHVTGIVIHDPDPNKHSTPGWLPSSTPLYHYRVAALCPIFILFKKVGDEYEPFEPGINAMIKAVFRSKWQLATQEDKLGSEMPGAYGPA